MYMMVSILGQSLMVTGFTVIVLHTIISPYYNILHKAISYCFHGHRATSIKNYFYKMKGDIGMADYGN